MQRPFVSVLGLLVVAQLAVACGADDASEPAPASPPVETPTPAAPPASTGPSAPAGDFAIEAASPVIVRAGASASFDVVVKRGAGFTGSVSIELVNLPAGVSAQVSGIGAGDVATVSLTASSDAALGDHEVIVRGRGQGISHDVEAPLIVAGEPGALDTTFGGGGLLKNFAQGGYAVVEDRTGALTVVGGELGKAYAVRFDTKAGLVTTFAGTGTARLAPAGTTAFAYAAAALEDGTLLIGGAATPAVGPKAACVAKVDATGALVPTFGFKGWACGFADVAQEVRAIRVLASGAILIAGTQGNDLFVARLTADGELDESFGTKGVAPLTVAGGLDFIDMAADGQGRAVVGARCHSAASGCVFRLGSSGQPDTSFNAGVTPGFAIAKVGQVASEMYAMALAPSGSIYLTGRTGTPGHTAIAAVDINGAPLSSFGAGGSLTYALYPTRDVLGSAWLEGGKVLSFGLGAEAGGSRLMAARVDEKGQLDPAFAMVGHALYRSIIAEGVRAISASPGRATALLTDQGGAVSLVRIWR